MVRTGWKDNVACSGRCCGRYSESVWRAVATKSSRPHYRFLEIGYSRFEICYARAEGTDGSVSGACFWRHSTRANANPERRRIYVHDATWPAAGGAVHDPAAALPKGGTIIETLLAPGDWLMTRLRNGTQYLTMHKLIGEDGKTMVQTIKAIGPLGRPVEQVQVFHRE